MLILIKELLEGLGVTQVYTATNGEAGLEIVKKLDPDVIVCDWEMPEFNGLEFTKEIRTNKIYPNFTVPIIMLTGYSTASRVADARDVGITEYVVKPFTAESLVKRIVNTINHPRGFVECETYVGPDRRRKQNPDYQVPFRREGDKDKAINIDML